MEKCISTGRVKPVEIVIGAVYYAWQVLEYSHKSDGGNIFYKCACVCGEIKNISGSRIIRGETKSCGCAYRKGVNKTHGLRNHPLYNVWRGMKYRCLTATAPNYNLYGGRGIKVCDRWIDSVQNFYDDMVEGYVKGLHLDRIDVNGHYCKDNCRWATPTENNNNKRTNVYICMDGRTHTPKQVSEITGIKIATIKKRMQYGWSAEEIFRPVKQNK